MYLVGEPVCWDDCSGLDREEFQVPVGQVNACLEVLTETPSTGVADILRDEYLSIVQALVDMGIEFRIIYSHPDMVDEQMLAICHKAYRCKFCRFTPDFLPSTIMYPRDFCTVMPGIILFNPQVQLLTERKDGYRLLSSPYGQGGRAWVAKSTMIVGERIIGENKSWRATEDDYGAIQEEGIQVGLVPPPIGTYIKREGLTDRFYPNDHLDRVGGMLVGKDGESLHLVVDSQILTTDYVTTSQGQEKVPLDPATSIARIQATCDSLGVTLHIPSSPLTVPYVLNFVQFPDGRVLMTSGDAVAQQIVSSIAGKENVFTTRVPIRFLPVYTYAGIHCIVSEAPMPILKRA